MKTGIGSPTKYIFLKSLLKKRISRKDNRTLGTPSSHLYCVTLFPIFSQYCYHRKVLLGNTPYTTKEQKREDCGKYTQEGTSVRFGADSSLHRPVFVHSESDSRTLKKYINKHKNLCINLLNFRHCNVPSNHRNEDLQALFWLPLGALKRRRSPLVSFGSTRRPCFS